MNITAPNLEIIAQVSSSPELSNWLQHEHISIAFTTYQTNRLILLGSNPESGLTVTEQVFDKPMGLYGNNHSLYMSTRYQIWQLDNCLLPGEIHQQSDRLYIPSRSYTTGDLNVHDLVLDATGTPLFINTDFSCLATIKSGYSFAPVWQPPFITKLVAEDRCHLNGLAMVAGKPTYVTACSATDKAAGWRDHRQNGGIVIHIPSNEIIATNLSMPHSPRWYQNKLWLLNAGTGELGYLNDSKFVPITFCSGFVRGLAFWGNYALVGTSKLRTRNFTGLSLENRLQAEKKQAECGLLVINLKNGEIVHWLRLETVIEELFDVVVLPGVSQPKALGFENEDIQRLITFPGSQGIVTSKPTVKSSSLNNAAIVTEKSESVNFKFQQVYHLNAESLAPYDPYTFPSLQQRWQTQPQRGELVGVSASLEGEMVGFAIGELLPNFQGELLSLFVAPIHRQQGICTQMMVFLERELLQQNAREIGVIYAPTTLTAQALEPMLQKLGWQLPTNINQGEMRLSRKQLIPLVNRLIHNIHPDARSQFEEGKKLVKLGDLEKAVGCFQAAIKIQPDYIPAYNQLGNTWQGLGKFEEAISAYQKSLKINPHLAAAYCNLGAIWQLQNQDEQAIAAYQKAIEIKPDFTLAHLNLGKLYVNKQQLSLAEKCLRQALLLIKRNFSLVRQAANHYAANCGKTDRIRVLLTLIIAYLESGLIEMAQQYFQQLEAILLQPNITLQESEVKLLYKDLVFYLPYLRDRIDLNGHLNKVIARAYNQLCLTPVNVPETRQISPKSGQESAQPLRIGIISKHFRRHSVGWCSQGIIKEWSKLTPHLHLYFTGRDPFDDLTEEFKQMTDNFFDFSEKSNIDMLEKLRRDNLDILIDMDSVMNPNHALILYHSPAKAVFSWLGCEPPYISEKNYYLCDRYTHPPSVQTHYQEQLIRMPDFAVAIANFTAKIIERDAVRKDLDITANNVVYLCVASGNKISPESVKSHISIIKQVPDSILLHKGYYDVEIVRSLYQQECKQTGIDPERCRFMVRQKLEEDHRIVYQIADILLDNYPYNGGTHNLESLWFNLPIVTLSGEQATSRMGSSFLKAVGISEGVAKNWKEYIEWGVKLGTDLDLRHQLQQKLIQSKQKDTLSPIWNPQKFAIEAYNLFQTFAERLN
ncbi:TIGR03032 family protein [Dolichospermum sp. ST_sed8]|nr:TIGR03032 family protein [Dolichospermum sp. ST_sed8]